MPCQGACEYFVSVPPLECHSTVILNIGSITKLPRQLYLMRVPRASFSFFKTEHKVDQSLGVFLYPLSVHVASSAASVMA